MRIINLLVSRLTRLRLFKIAMKNYTVINKNGCVIEIRTFSAKDSTIISEEMIKLGINAFSVYEGLPLGKSKAEKVIEDVRNWKLGDIASRNGLGKTYVLKAPDYENDGKVFYLGGLKGNPLLPYSNNLMTQGKLNEYLRNFEYCGELGFSKI